MPWTRFTDLVVWLPADSWWYRFEHPAPKQPAVQAGAAAPSNSRVRVIDAAANPELARSYFAGMAAGGNN